MTSYAKIDNNLIIDGVSFIDELSKIQFKKTNNAVLNLNAGYRKIDYIPGLKTTLYPHQQTTVMAMLETEAARKITLLNNRLTYNAAVLSEPVGSGKTIDLLALVLMSRVPRAMPDIMEFPYYHGMSSYIKRRFHTILKPTIIFVGTSVMRQWEAAIQTFTDLKYYAVNSLIELRPLLTLMESKALNDYDIILVKNGRITKHLSEFNDSTDIMATYNNGRQDMSIYNIIASRSNVCWSRVIIDDFDTIKLPAKAKIVNGLFTWYVSSTQKSVNRLNPAVKSIHMSEILNTYSYTCSAIMNNSALFGYLNIRNDTEYIKNTTNMPMIKYHVAILKNPDNKYMAMLAAMGDSDINRITEMLNGDAIESAAEATGIKTSSVADIFGKILGKKFEAYRFAGDLLAFIDHCRETESERKKMSDNPDSNDTYNKSHLLKFREIEYKYPGINSLLDEAYDEYTNIKKENGIAIDRVKENIKHGECPVCMTDLSDCDEVFIIKCCNAVFCGGCGITAQNLHERFNNLKNGRCSNCRATVGIKDLIYIGTEIKMESIIEEDFEAQPVKKVEKKKRTKYGAIMDIIRSGFVAEGRRVDMHIPNMMKGNYVSEEPKKRKVLIFANYEETLEKMIKELEEEKIHYWRLMGTTKEISAMAQQFNAAEGPCAMVINSTQHCSGLNLQTATDLVFSHNIIDPAVESQVAGRGHRLGRTSPLNIWYVQYDNEYDQLLKTHNVRDMTERELKEEVVNYQADENYKKTNQKYTKAKTKYEHHRPATKKSTQVDEDEEMDYDNTDFSDEE